MGKVLIGIQVFLFSLIGMDIFGQCPSFSNFQFDPPPFPQCEGAPFIINHDAQNVPAGSAIDWFIGEGTFNPYAGEGDFVGSNLIVTNDVVPEFIITIPADFCETNGSGDWYLIGILNPAPSGVCQEIFTDPIPVSESCASVSIEGDGIICAGNCPDMPNQIDFIVIGEDVPVILDLEFSASLFPPMAINDIEISQGQSLTICLEGVLPSYDPATYTLSVPEFAVGFTATVQIIGGTTNSGCPVTIDNDLIDITFIEAPTAVAGDDQVICAGENITLIGQIGGSSNSGLWTTSGDGVFDDPNLLSTIYHPGPDDIFNESVILILTSVDSDDACIPATSQINVTITPSLDVQVVAPLTLCDNDIAELIAVLSDPDIEMIWETTGDGSFTNENDPETFYEPGLGDIGNGSVTLSYQPLDPDQCVISIPQVTISIVPAPEIVVPGPIELCAGEIANISLEVSGNYTSVQWDTDGDGDLMIVSETEVNYTPGPMDIQDQFVAIVATIQSSFPACGQITHIIPINISPCDCPPFETIPPTEDLCAENDLLDLNTLIVEAENGNWTITTQPPGNPATIVNDEFITSMSAAGVYVVTYTLNNPEPGCPSSSSESIEVIDPSLFQPVLGSDVSSCGFNTVLLTVEFPQLTPEEYEWISTGTGVLVPDINDPVHSATYMPSQQDIDAGFALLVFSSNSICGNVTDTVQINLLQPLVVNFTFDTIPICNLTENGSIWNAAGMLQTNSQSGVYSVVPFIPVDLTDPMSIDFNGISEGYYTFYYTTTGAVDPCLNAVDSIVVEVDECECPFLAISEPPPICQTFSALPLSPFIMAGAPGTWQIISTPGGSNPGIIVGDSFIPNGGDVGEYELQFSFTTPPPVGCVPSISTTLLVQEATIVTLDAPLVSCGQEIIDLNYTVSGPPNTVSWLTSGLGTFSNITPSTAEYFPTQSDVASAFVLLVGVIEDPNEVCPDHRDTVSVQLVTPPSTRFTSLSDTLCTEPDSIHGINFTQLIIEGDGTGTWMDIDDTGADFSNPTWVDFTNTGVGVYRIHYTTMSAVSPCVDSTYEFLLTIKACTCPPIELNSDPVEICSDSIFQLNDLIINAGSGTWSITGGPGGLQLNGSELNASQANPGLYTLTYTIDDIQPNCPSFGSVQIQINQSPEWMLLEATCNDDKTLYEVIIDTDDMLLSVNAGVIDNSISGQIRLHSIAAGLDIHGELISMSGCVSEFSIPAIDCSCTIVTEDIADTVFFCPGDTFVLLPFVTGGQGLTFSTWITPDEQVMWPTIRLSKEGQYIWIVRDESGCEKRDTFSVRFEGPREIVFTSLNPSCPGLDDGEITITELPGGEFPYEISVAGSNFSSLLLPHTISNVSTSPVLVQIRDNNQCLIETTIELTAPQTGSLDLGDDVIIPLGDSVFIDPAFSGFVPNVWMWRPTDRGNVQNFWHLAENDVLIGVDVSDENGCVHTDSMRVRVVIESGIFTPNVFTPNNDGINDHFIAIPSNDQTLIQSLDIFDRWGNHVYHQQGIGPFTWNGKNNDIDVSPGVYAYRIGYTGSFGQDEILYGDVTVVR